MLDERSTTTVAALPARDRRTSSLGLAFAVAGLATGAVSAWLLLRNQGQAAPTVTQFAINPPPTDSLRFDTDGPTVALSPDGQTVVFTATRGGASQLFRRRLGDLQAEAIAGTTNGYHPFFSPEGRSVGFFSAAGIHHVSVDGGTPIEISKSPNSCGGSATWGRLGTIVLGACGVGTNLQRVSSAGGDPATFTLRSTDQSENDLTWPDVLPEERGVVFGVDYAGNRPSEIMALAMRGGERRRLLQGTFPRYSPTGHLLFMRGNVLWAAGFDPRALEVTGQARPILQNVRPGQYAVSNTGTLAYAPSPEDAAQTLVWVDQTGKEEPLNLPPRLYLHPTLSPDARQLAVAIDTDIWLYRFRTRYAPPAHR